MNILFLHSSSDLYGASTILLSIVKNVKRNGHKPFVVVSDDGPLVSKLRESDVEVRIIKLGILRRKYFSLPGFINRTKVIMNATKVLRQLIIQHNINIMYSNTTGVLIGALLARRIGVKHIWHIHEIITSPRIFNNVIGFLLNRYSDKVIVVSEAVKDHWTRWVNSPKVIKINNGIETKAFANKTGMLKRELKLSDDTILVGMIGRVNLWKGQEYFLRIAGEICRHRDDVRFIMAGDAYPGNEYLYDKLTATILEEGIQGKVFQLGYRQDIVNILNSLDIFILPSLLPDPFPTVILEAMAAGKPVVATRQGGACEMIEDGVSGILIPLNDATEAAKQVGHLIDHPSERLEMGKKGQDRMYQHFSLEAFDESIIKVLD